MILGYVVELWHRLHVAAGVAPAMVDSPLESLIRTCALAQLIVPDAGSQMLPLVAELVVYRLVPSLMPTWTSGAGVVPSALYTVPPNSQVGAPVEEPLT